MSGGSFDYLYAVGELDDLYLKRLRLEEMATYLMDIGAVDAGWETRDIQLDLIRFERLQLHRAQRLAGVWKAVEWVVSADWSPAQIDQALAEYRKESS